MNKFRLCLMSGMAAIFGVSQAAPGAAPANPYQPLAFLAAHCWRGSFPDGKQTDEHCFSWVYGQKFLRDRHRVRGGADSAEHGGESIYYWNSVAQQIEYLYIETDGGFSHGSMRMEGDTLVFPDTGYVEDGKTMNYRSRWVHTADNTYDVETEFQGKDGWRPGFKMRMQRVD